MTTREFISQKISEIGSEDIIFNKGIPKNIKTLLTLDKVAKGIVISRYKDDSFSVFVTLEADKGVIILFTITMYNELFCKAVVPCTDNMTMAALNKQIELIGATL